jgi:hypothetical protein
MRLALIPTLLLTTVAAGGPCVELRPAVVTLRHTAMISVRLLDAPELDVELAGATNAKGQALPWRPLHRVDGAWIGTLPAPSLRGVYPVLLRTGPEGVVDRSPSWLLRVLAPGTLARRSFATPAEVARWWVRTVPHGTLRALKRWPRPAFDRRDPRLHRLFVVAYSPPDRPAVKDRLGMFVTAFRDRYDGRWRLLEATVQP